MPSGRSPQPPVSRGGHRHRLELRPRRRPRTGSRGAPPAADRIARAAPAGPRRRRAQSAQRGVDGADAWRRCGISTPLRPAPARSGSSPSRPRRCATPETAALFMDRIRRELRHPRGHHRRAARRRDYGFAGAVRGLPVASGLLFDLGGGSMQVSHFRDRRLGRAASLPLGALRLSEAFLESDPPRPSRDPAPARPRLEAPQARAGRAGSAVASTWSGTGGTLRNLAKIDRNAHRYPITPPARLRAHARSPPRRRRGIVDDASEEPRRHLRA